MSFKPVVFFFQAEDGIRDRDVTGVQTCALPISLVIDISSEGDIALATDVDDKSCHGPNRRRHSHEPAADRSEERRVGKECRARVSPYHEKKKRYTSDRRGSATRDIG